MDIGVVLQTTPPSARVIDLGTKAETYGFSHVWTFDSHILWQEPFPIYTQILANTRKVIVGSMVTNPATRDWTVTASAFATLNEMFGNRTVIGIGRGDSAVRVINGKPTTLATLRESVGVIRELVNGRDGRVPRLEDPLPVGVAEPRRGVGRGLRSQGAQADRRGRRRVHPAARRPAHHRVDDRRGPHGRRAGRARPRRRDDLRRGAGVRHRRRGARPRPVPVVRGHGRQPRRRHRRALRRAFGGPGGAHRLHQGPRGLRLQRARPGGQRPHRVRAGRDHRPLLHPRTGRGARAASGGAEGAGRRTSSPSTCSTTRRTRPCRPTARRSSRPSPTRSARSLDARSSRLDVRARAGAGRRRLGALQGDRAAGRRDRLRLDDPAARERHRDAARVGDVLALRATREPRIVDPHRGRRPAAEPGSRSGSRSPVSRSARSSG